MLLYKGLDMVRPSKTPTEVELKFLLFQGRGRLLRAIRSLRARRRKPIFRQSITTPLIGLFASKASPCAFAA